MTKHLDEIIALCEEALETDILDPDDFRIDNALKEIKDLAQQAKEDAEPSPFSILNRMTPTSVTFSGELSIEKKRKEAKR